MPLAEALHVLLGLLRDSGSPQRVVAVGGQFQQSLPVGRSYHLMRVRLPQGSPLVPEISGHRLMAMVRLMQPDGEGRLRPSAEDAEFELTLCS
jgi:cell division protein ZapD